MNGRRGFLHAATGLATGAIASALARRAAAQDMPGMPMPPSTAPVSAAAVMPPAPGGKAMSMASPPPLPRGAPPPASPLYKRYALDLRVVQHEIVPGYVVHMMAYNGQVPAPTIRVNEGDWVWVDFTNSSDEMHTIHWHGMILEYRHDGVPYLTQDPIMRGEKYSYVFQAKPYGTHFYHAFRSDPSASSPSARSARRSTPVSPQPTLVTCSWTRFSAPRASIGQPPRRGSRCSTTCSRAASPSRDRRLAESGRAPTGGFRSGRGA
jgi:hypothetical protein